MSPGWCYCHGLCRKESIPEGLVRCRMDEQLSRNMPIPFVNGGTERLERYFNMSSDDREKNLSSQVMHDIVEAARLYVDNCISIKKILGG